MLKHAAVVALVPFFAMGFIYDDPAPTMMASFYATGIITANGETFDPSGMTAAHRRLPFGSLLRVRNIANKQEIVVRINDRGPYVDGRSLDLTIGAAQQLGMIEDGVAEVTVLVLLKGPGPKSARAVELISSR
jgi:rare lipoprotein A